MPLDRPGCASIDWPRRWPCCAALWSDEPCTVRRRRTTGSRGLDGHPKPLTPGGPPIVIGGGGRRILALAGREADVVGINVNLAAGVIDRQAFWNGTPETTDEKVRWVREGAGDRDPELHVRVHLAMVTDDRDGIVEQLSGGFGLTPDQARETPHALVGDVSEICDQLVERRERWGISYLGLSADQLEPFAPVIARLAGDLGRAVGRRGARPARCAGELPPCRPRPSRGSCPRPPALRPTRGRGSSHRHRPCRAPSSSGPAVDRKSGTTTTPARPSTASARAVTGTGVRGTTTLARTVAARSCSRTPALPATRRASHSASKPACGCGVPPLADDGGGGGLGDGTPPTMATLLPSSEPSGAERGGHRALAGRGLVERDGPILGTRQARQVVRVDADARPGEPPAALHQRRDLLEERGQRRVAVVGLGVEAGRAAADGEPEARRRVGGRPGEELGAIAQHLRRLPHHPDGRRIAEVERDEPVGALELQDLHGGRVSSRSSSTRRPAGRAARRGASIDAERLDEEVGHLLVGIARRPGCGTRRRRRPPRGRTGHRRRSAPMPQNGRSSLGSKGWRITGTSEPGARSSQARWSGRGIR